MANCESYCVDPVGDHSVLLCEAVLGGISDVILLECDHQLTDPSSASQINAEIAANRATLVKQIKVGMEAPSPIEIDSQVSCSPSRVVNYDRTITLLDGSVDDANVDFYNDVLDGRRFGGLILHECGTETDRVTWVDSAVTLQGGRIIPNDDNEAQRFEATAAWKNISMGNIFAVPIGIF